MIYRLLDIPFDVLSDLANLEFNFNFKTIRGDEFDTSSERLLKRNRCTFITYS